jgi:hypothetical protein
LDSYIIRVYRRGNEPGKEAAGLVEHAGNGKRAAFGGRDELWAFVCGTTSPSKRAGARSRRAAKSP